MPAVFPMRNVCYCDITFLVW